MTVSKESRGAFGSRYHVIREVGKGAQGAVVLVNDRYHPSRQIVIKTLISRKEEEWQQLFVREFELLSGLDHPRLAKVYDFGTSIDGKLFFTRDFVDGTTLSSLPPLFDVAKLLSISVETCRALAPLHRAGLLHGDLKPANIVLGKDGVVKLIDFSFAKAAGISYMGGTSANYAPPEFIEERALDVRADLYSLGITLYELASGLPPFEGTLGEVISRHLDTHRPLLKPRASMLENRAMGPVLEGFISIVDRLISRNSDDRYPDIEEVEAALTSLLPKAVKPDRVWSLPIQSSTSGRDAELRKVKEAIVDRLKSSEDHPLLHVVKGELGTGRSAVVQGVKWHIQLAGFTVVEGSCEGGRDGWETSAKLLEQVLDVMSKDNEGRASGEELRSALENPRKMELDRLAVQIGKQVRYAAADMPLLITVNDLEQASTGTLKILRGIIAQCALQSRVAILAVADVCFDSRRALGQGMTFTLPLFDKEQVSALVSDYLGSVDPGVVDKIMTHTGGNPLYVRTLLADMSSQEKKLGVFEKLGPPRKLESYWRERFCDLNEASQGVVKAAIVIGKAASVERLGRVSEQRERDTKDILERLSTAGWITESADGWRPTAAAILVDVLENTNPKRLERMHKEAINGESDEALILFHAGECKEHELLRERGLDVAADLERVGSLQDARRMYMLLKNTFGGEENFQGVALALGRICSQLSEYKEAQEHLSPLLGSHDKKLSRRAWILLGQLHGAKREDTEAMSCLDTALAIDGTLEESAQIYCDLANAEFRRGEFNKAEIRAKEGLEMAPPARRVRCDLLAVQGKIASFLGKHERALALCEDALVEAKETKDLKTVAFSTQMLSWTKQQSGDLSGAIEDLKQTIFLYREAGDLRRLMRAQLVLGDLYWWVEDWGKALGLYEETVRMSGTVGNPAWEVQVNIGLGQALAKVGRFERASLLLAEAREEATRLCQEQTALNAMVFEGDVSAWQGQTNEALEQWKTARVGLSNLGQMGVCAELDLEMAELHLWRKKKGDVEAADELIARAEDREREELGRNFDHMAVLVKGMYALAINRFEDGISILDSLIEKLSNDNIKDLKWQAHLVKARTLVEHGSIILARQELRLAESILEQLAGGLPAEHRIAFWQDVRRAEIRRLMALTTPSSNYSLIDTGQGENSPDPEAASLYHILEINKRLTTETNLDRLLDSILDAAIELTGAERGFVLTPQRDGLVVRAVRELDSDEAKESHEQFSKSIAESVYLDNEPVITVDASGDDRFNDFESIHALKIRSVACIPVSYRGKIEGVLYLENRLRRGRFDRRDLRVLSAFSDQMAIAISQATLIEGLKKSTEDLKATTATLKETCARQSEDLATQDKDLMLISEQLERTRSLADGTGDYHGAVGTGPSMARVFEVMERVKDMNVPVIFTGASGTGKDMLAKILHSTSYQSKMPFVPISCGGIPENLVETALFGHAKGAFSGAYDTRSGLFAAASGGTLYLDDIGEMPKRMQVDLLRVLQDGCFTPVGGDKLLRTNFRLIASTKEPLDDLVKAGRLREDLLYRLKVISISLPLLKDRPEDIPFLARRFGEQESKRLDKPGCTITPDAFAALIKHPWTGNVRELAQMIRRAIVISDSGVPISAESIFDQVTLPSQSDLLSYRSTGENSVSEKERVIAALEKCQWNKSQAAQMLGIPRRTFYRRLSKLDLINPKNSDD